MFVLRNRTTGKPLLFSEFHDLGDYLIDGLVIADQPGKLQELLEEGALPVVLRAP